MDPTGNYFSTNLEWPYIFVCPVFFNLVQKKVQGSTLLTEK